MSPTEKVTTVIGAGTMGYGIALGFAIGEWDVRLYDLDRAVLRNAEERIATSLEALVDAELVPAGATDAITDRIRYEESLEDAVSRVSYVTEAVPESMEVKHEVFEEISAHAPGDAILATNTSGLSITDIAKVVDDPGRVVGTHYFNPAHILPVVEVVAGQETTEATMETTSEVLDRIGKTPVTVREEIPGFIVNRIQSAMVYEAESLVESGIATPEEIDRAVRGSFGLRMPVMGLFEIADLEGLDVHVDVLDYLMEDLDRGTEPHTFLRERIDAGKLGIKSGEGIYEWEADQETVLTRRDTSLLEQLKVYESVEGL